MPDVGYKYDGTFCGFLTVIYDVIKNGDRPLKIDSIYKDESDLFLEYIFIKSDEEKSNQVLNHFLKNNKGRVIKDIFYAFLSNENEIEIKIFNYISQVIKNSKNIRLDYSNNEVLSIRKIVDRVKLERHRFLGILRFNEINFQNNETILYASIKPDNNIVYLVATHFKERLKNQKFLIHDMSRGVGVYYDKKILSFIDITLNEEVNSFYTEEEKTYQKLWQTYFKNIAIKERRNLKLQRQFIPTRYWKYLTEKL